MNQQAESREKEAISKLSQRYMSAGYSVEEQPELPELMAQHYRPDLVARRNGETIIIEVKVAPGPKLDGPRWSTIADAIRAIPGWRFILAIATQEAMLEIDATSLESLRARIQQFRQTNGLPPEAALLYAWSLFEAAARLVFIRQGAPPERLSASKALVDSLIYRGNISQEEGDELRILAQARNQTAHGIFAATISREQIDKLLTHAEALLAEEPT